MTIFRLAISTSLALAACRSEAEHRVTPPPEAPRDAAEHLPPERDVSIVHAAVLLATGDPIDVAMPIGPHRSGEQVRDAWVAPDGTEFLLGYMYTGVPGPDTGVVYRRRPGQRVFEIFHTFPEHELGNIAGISSTDFYISGSGVLAHYDGTWHDLERPPGVKSVSTIALDGDTLWLASWDKQTISHRKLDETTWVVETPVPWPYDAIAIAGDHVFASGVSIVVHRYPDGHWVREIDLPHHGIDSIYVASPKDIYIAGETGLLHTTGNGKWTPIAAPAGVETYDIWGRSPSEIYVTTRDNVYVWRGKRGFSPTPLRTGRLLKGNADKILVAYEVDHTERPLPP